MSDAIAVFICSAIFAWSSWESSFCFSASFSWRRRAFWLTAALAWSAAWVDCNDRVLRFSISASFEISWLANASAAVVNSAALVASPPRAASSAMITACCALRLSFSSSSIAAFRRISVCFWLAMTLAACSLSRRCWSWASVMACSSWILGSAFSLKALETFAPMYFHHFFNDFHMAASLGQRPRRTSPPTRSAIGSKPGGRASTVDTAKVTPPTATHRATWPMALDTST